MTFEQIFVIREEILRVIDSTGPEGGSEPRDRPDHRTDR
jgi:hypothetical protein